MKHLGKKSFFTIYHNGIVSDRWYYHNGNRNLCARNRTFSSHCNEFGYCNFIHWYSLYVLHINRRNESCCMDRCYSIQLDDRRKGSSAVDGPTWPLSNFGYSGIFRLISWSLFKGLFAVTVYSGKQIEGGFEFIWDKARAHRTDNYGFWTHPVSPDLAVENGRADFFVSSWDPTVRNSLQAVILGNFFGLNAYSFWHGLKFYHRSGNFRLYCIYGLR